MVLAERALCRIAQARSQCSQRAASNKAAWPAPSPVSPPYYWGLQSIQRSRETLAKKNAGLWGQRHFADVLGNLVAPLHRRSRGDRQVPALHIGVLVHVDRLPLEARDPRPDRNVGDRIVVRHVRAVGEAPVEHAICRGTLSEGGPPPLSRARPAPCPCCISRSDAPARASARGRPSPTFT